jgi:hypothetical protein
MNSTSSENAPAVNMGSPVGPGFVVYERAPGQPGYDLKMAKDSVGPGWAHLVQAFFDAKEYHTKYNPNLGWQNVVVIQVKEKYGRLCIYVVDATPEIKGFVEALEAISLKTCEVCGKPSRGRPEKRTTLCDGCAALPHKELRSQTEQQEERL